MPLALRNLDYIRSKDPRLAETFKDIVEQFAVLESQVNGSATGEPKAPPAVNSVNVMGGGGIFDIAITDRSDSLYRGIHYFVDHSDTPQFTNFQTIHVGTTRNWRGTLGSTSRYFRAYSAYPTGVASAPAYHGGNTQPQIVDASGASEPPFQASQGSGTGAQGVGLSGFGPVPFRGTKPPIR